MKLEYKSYYKKLGLNIAYYRKSNGFTQEVLAEKIGIDQTHMSKIEVASVGVSLDVLFAIAQALHVAHYKLLDYREKRRLGTGSRDMSARKAGRRSPLRIK